MDNPVTDLEGLKRFLENCDKRYGATLETDGTNLAVKSKDGTTLCTVKTQDTVYTHPVTDGHKHIPANGTTNNGKFLKAGETAGTYTWEDATKEDVGISNDFTDLEKEKLSGIEPGAEVNQNAYSAIYVPGAGSVSATSTRSTLAIYPTGILSATVQSSGGINWVYLNADMSKYVSKTEVINTTPFMRCFCSGGTQTLTSSSDFKVLFTNNLCSNTSLFRFENNGIEILQDGYYEISGMLMFNSSTNVTNVKSLSIFKDGARWTWARNRADINAGISGNPLMTLVFPGLADKFTAGQTIHMYARDESGSGVIDLSGAVTQLQVKYLGPI